MSKASDTSPRSELPVPLYYNPDSGSSEKIIALIGADSRLRPEPVPPAEMALRVKKAVGQGGQRVVVSGGDGSIGLAASQLAGTKTELAIIPSSTLNHFAQRCGIPTNAAAAVEVALHSLAKPVDVGYVNKELFVNTSSVGAYPTFVRSRNYLENRMHYLPATIVAGIHRLLKFRLVRLTLAGRQRRTPFVFIGVGEREMSLPVLGQVKKDGRHGLQFIAVECTSKLELFLLVIKALLAGIDPMKKKIKLESQIVDNVDLNFHHQREKITVALDGELHKFQAHLKYRFAPGELLVALPDSTQESTSGFQGR